MPPCRVCYKRCYPPFLGFRPLSSAEVSWLKALITLRFEAGSSGLYELCERLLKLGVALGCGFSQISRKVFGSIQKRPF